MNCLKSKKPRDVGEIYSPHWTSPWALGITDVVLLVIYTDVIYPHDLPILSLNAWGFSSMGVPQQLVGWLVNGKSNLEISLEYFQPLGWQADAGGRRRP